MRTYVITAPRFQQDIGIPTTIFSHSKKVVKHVQWVSEEPSVNSAKC